MMLKVWTGNPPQNWVNGKKPNFSRKIFRFALLIFRLLVRWLKQADVENWKIQWKSFIAPALPNVIIDNFFPSPSASETVYKTGPFFILHFFREYIKQSVKHEDKIGLASPNHFTPLLHNELFAIFNSRCKKPDSPACKEWIDLGRKQNETHEILIRKPYLVHRFLHIGYINNKKFKTHDACNTTLDLSRYLRDLSWILVDFIKCVAHFDWIF